MIPTVYQNENISCLDEMFLLDPRQSFDLGFALASARFRFGGLGPNEGDGPMASRVCRSGSLVVPFYALLNVRRNPGVQAAVRASDDVGEPCGHKPGFGGGKGGIRTHEGLRLAAFQERCLKPLGHLSIPGNSTRVKLPGLAEREGFEPSRRD